MKKTEKIQMIKEVVEERLQKGDSVDQVSENVYTQFGDRLKITEVAGLVREIGKETGLIIPVKVKRENAQKALDKDFIPTDDVEELKEAIDHYTSTFGVTETFVKSVMKDMYEEEDMEMPKAAKTRKHGGWRLALAEALRDDSTLTDKELVSIVEPHVSSAKVAGDYVRDFAWMIRVAIDA